MTDKAQNTPTSSDQDKALVNDWRYKKGLHAGNQSGYEVGKDHGRQNAIHQAITGQLAAGYGVYNEAQVREREHKLIAKIFREIRKLRGSYKMPAAADIIIQDIKKEVQGL